MPYRNKYIIDTHYKTKRKALRIGIVLTALILALIALTTFFSQNTGTFTITLDEKDNAILSIADNKNFDNQTSYLSALARKDVWPVDYSSIDVESVMRSDGDSNVSGNYLGYTFYLKNEGEQTANIEGIIRLGNSRLALYKCTRFMLIEDDHIVGIFRHYDEIEVDEDPTPRQYYMFAESDDIIYRFRIPYLRPQQVVKYSIIIWIDGWDADCTDEKRSGSVNYSMWFSVSSIYKKEN